MDERWAGGVAIVTGASSGIGRSAAERLVAGGLRVIGIGTDRARTEDAAASVGFTPIVGSVGDAGLWERVLDQVALLGRLGIVILNAGRYGFIGPVEELPLDLYHETVAANVDGVVLGVRAVVPVLRDGGGGAIVVTASTAGLVPSSLNSIYTLTKHAVVGFVRAEADALAPHQITINAVCPSFVDTPLTDAALAGADPGALGIDLLAPAAVVDAMVALADGGGTGRCVALHAGHVPVDWRFNGYDDQSDR